MNGIVFKVEGMYCEKRIQNSIRNLEIVESVVANHNVGIVKILLNENIDKQFILDKIENIGLEVREEQ